MNEIKEFKQELEDKLKQSDQVFITPHLNADFDAIASSIGFSLIANKFSKPNYIFMCDDPYKMEPGVKTIIEECQGKANFIGLDKYKKIKSDNDMLIATDVNKKYLVGCKDYLENFANIAILDHHQPDENTIETELKCFPKDISSACEAMVILLCQYGIKYDATVANYLLSGIFLDTDKFKKGVTSKTFEIISKLIKKGASLDKVQDYFAEDFKNDQKIQALVQKTILDTYTYALAVEKDEIYYSREDLAKVADKLLSYKTVDASFAVGKLDENTISISARSKGRIDVSQIMAAMSGGGNVFSAATKLENEDIEEVEQKLTRVLKPGFCVKDKTI